MIEEKENALRIILTKYKFKEIEIDKICKDLKGKDINIGNAESILEKLKDLAINGHDMIALGLKGPEIGKALNDALEAVIEEQASNDKQSLIDFVKAQI